jgi:type IV pilus assembly protein PilC
MKLAYTAYDGVGKTASGVIEADDAMAASEVLRRKGLYVAEMVEQKAGLRQRSARRQRRVSGSQRLKNTAMFSRQLQVLISSGTQLVDALRAIERQSRPGPWRDVVAGLRGRVEEGASLSDAMEAHRDYFDNSVVGAMIYPCMLLTLGLTVFVLLLIFVVPRFSMLFKTLDVPLPASTNALLQVSAALRHFWWLMGLLLGGALFALVSYLRTPRGRRLRDVSVLRVPYIGGVVRNLSSARIICMLGILMQARIPVLEALRLVRRSAGNVLYEELIAQAEEYVARGEPMSQAFSDTALFSPSIYEAIRSGEHSGEVDRLLLNVSGFLDEENEVTVRSLTSIIEPVILIVMGVLVGLIAICMFLPLFDLTAMTQGGT